LYSPPDWASDTPTAADLGYESLNQAATIQHLVGGPPEVPDERISVLEQALLDTLDSDEMQSWAEENEVPITPGDSQEAADTVSSMRETFGQYEDVFREEVFTE
jgi:tripartite-type tricarboxylate transporter receptor subunit TctC